MHEKSDQQTAQVADELELESPEAFLESRKIGHLADTHMTGHGGEMMTLAEAIGRCDPIRDEIDEKIQIAKDAGGPDVDVTPILERSFERLSEKAQAKQITPNQRAKAEERAEAEKK